MNEQDIPPVIIDVLVSRDEGDTTFIESAPVEHLHRRAGRLIAEMDTNVIRRILRQGCIEEARLSARALDEEAGRWLVEQLPLPECDAHRATVHVYPGNVADVVIAAGRLNEFPDMPERILRMASPEVLERRRAARDARLILEYEPNLHAEKPASPAI